MPLFLSLMKEKPFMNPPDMDVNKNGMSFFGILFKNTIMSSVWKFCEESTFLKKILNILSL